MTLNWPMTVLLSVLIIVIGALAYKGLVPPVAVGGAVTSLLAWLAPSPLKPKAGPDA